MGWGPPGMAVAFMGGICTYVAAAIIFGLRVIFQEQLEDYRSEKWHEEIMKDGKIKWPGSPSRPRKDT